MPLSVLEVHRPSQINRRSIYSYDDGDENGTETTSVICRLRVVHVEHVAATHPMTGLRGVRKNQKRTGRQGCPGDMTHTHLQSIFTATFYSPRSNTVGYRHHVEPATFSLPGRAAALVWAGSGFR